KARSPQTPYTCGVCSCCGRCVAPGPRTDVSGKAGVTHLVLPPWTGGSEARGGHRVGERWRWTPLVLEERHSSELGQPVWAAGERSENGFLVGARQPDDRPSMPPGRLGGL